MINYSTYSTITISPENVASSTTFVAGVESGTVDNTSTRYDDILITGLWTAGTTPTANTQVNIYVVAMRDASVWPDVFDGTASAETITSVGVGAGFLRLGNVLVVDSATSNVAYDSAPFSVGQLFNGVLPVKFVLFITHNTGVNSNSTAGNHIWKYQGVNYTAT